MWSGPRNISTALMRSFDSRIDTYVSDEPLYAHYLAATGLPHPHADAIVRTHERDWRLVAEDLLGPTPADEAVWYQKHMAHHMLPEVERDWLSGFRHAFLVREPRAMLASLVDRLGAATLEDTGLPQQLELFRWVREGLGEAPPVIDAADVLASPEATLTGLCERLDIPFDPAMLSWEPGPRDTDGCWGPHWYQSTYRTTGFTENPGPRKSLDPAYEDLAHTCSLIYDELAAQRIRPDAIDA